MTTIDQPIMYILKISQKQFKDKYNKRTKCNKKCSHSSEITHKTHCYTT